MNNRNLLKMSNPNTNLKSVDSEDETISNALVPVSMAKKRNRDNETSEWDIYNPKRDGRPPSIGRDIKYDPKMYDRLVKKFGETYLRKIGQLHNLLSDEKIDMKKIVDHLEFFKNHKKLSNRTYLSALMFPEKVWSVRVPTKFPIPSATAHQKCSFTLSPNGGGNWVLQWCPQALLTSGFQPSGQLVGNLSFCNHPSLTGSAIISDLTKYSTISTDRLMDAGMIQAYRLVSASLVMTYRGSIDSHSGLLGGAVDISLTNSLTPDVNGSIFSTIDDKMWSLTVNPFDGLRLVYFPKDYSDLSFIKPDKSLSEQAIPSCVRMFVYGQNLPPGSTVRVDLYRNFEYVPLPNMTDFVNTDINKSGVNFKGEPTLDVGAAIAENNLAVTPFTKTPIIQNIIDQASKSGYLDVGEALNQIVPGFDVLRPLGGPALEKGIQVVNEVYNKDPGNRSFGQMLGDGVVNILGDLGKNTLTAIDIASLGSTSNMTDYGRKAIDWISDALTSLWA